MRFPLTMPSLLAIQSLLALAALTCAAPGRAEVLRCADAAGNASYTDGACPAGTRLVGRVAVPEPAAGNDDASARSRSDLRDAVGERPAGGFAPLAPVAAPAAPAVRTAPAGPTIIDSRGTSAASTPDADPRRSDRGSDLTVIDDGAYPYPGPYRRPAPQRDMRPRLRDCDGAGCRDTQGNHYDRAGRLDRYQGQDGRTCRPVGTTTVCR